MKQKDLMFILNRIIFILILFFLLFILFINTFKLVDYVMKVNHVIANSNSGEAIQVVSSDINAVHNKPDKEYRQDIAHTALQLGYNDALSELNGSEWGDGINYLLVASDKKTNKKGRARSDVIIVLRIIKTGKILSISIPRDTLITISDGKWAGEKDKIGHSYYWGGLRSLKNTVEELLGSPIYKIVIVDNFKSYESILAILGGINIDKTLEGKLGIQWIRNRQFRDGDIERCRRQQVFLKRALQKVWKITKHGNVLYANFMFHIFKKIVVTDITKDDFYNLLFILKENNFKPDKDFYTCVLPGKFDTYKSAILGMEKLACWNLESSEIKKMQFLFYSDEEGEQRVFMSKIKLIDFIKMDIKILVNDIKAQFLKKTSIVEVE